MEYKVNIIPKLLNSIYQGPCKAAVPKQYNPILNPYSLSNMQGTFDMYGFGQRRIGIV